MHHSVAPSPTGGATRGQLRRADAPSNDEQATEANLGWIVCNAPPMPAAMQAGLSGAASAASTAATAASADGTAASASASPPSAPSAFHLLDLGECRLGAIRTCVILLSNLSDARADCTLNYTSAAGTVSVEPRQIQIAPRQCVPVTIRVQARQLNPSYHKQILIENTQNPSNALMLMIRCNNTLDRHGAAFHNLFYHVINPADVAMRAASDVQASPPPPLLPVGFRETAAGKIKREEPQQEEQEQLDSAGPSAATTTDDEATSSGRNSARRRRKGSTASTGSRTGADDEIEDLLANVEDDSDLLPPPLLDMESTATRSSEHSTATSPLPVSPQLTTDASAVLTQQSLYQQQLLLQSNSCSTTPSLHTVATAAAAAAAASAAECARNSSSPIPPPQPTNVIQLGTLVCNHPIMRAIDVKNITASRLRLRLHSPLDPDRFNAAAAAAAQLSGAPVQPVRCVPEELVLYVKNEAKFALAGMELASDGSMVPRISPFSPSTLSSIHSPSSAHSASTLGSFVPFSLASPVSPHQNAQQSPAVPQPVLDSWCRFESVCVSGEHSAVYSHFADVAAERAYVKKFIMQQRDMEIVLREQMIVRLHEAEAQVAAELGIPPSGKNELVLAPFETKRIFVYVHIQSRLAVPPLPSGAAPPSLAFVSKDFQRNRLIKLEEKELRARDAQLYSILGLNPHASALPTLDRRRQLTDLLANNADGLSSTVTSPVHPVDQPQPDLGFPPQGPPPVFASPSSQPPIPESSPATAAMVPPLTSSSSISSAAPGLKIFFELVEFPQAISMGAPQASPTAAQMTTQQALRIDPLPPLPAPLLLPSPISDPVGLSADLQELLLQQSSGSTDSAGATVQGVRSPPRATPLAVSIPDALVSYSDTVTPAMSSAAASPAIGGSAAPIRSLLLPAYLCRSSLEVAQQHINFGQLLNMHVHSKSLVLSNLSEVPLLFMVRQTGSIASLDLTFPRGDIGVIPALGYSDLPFLFKPSLAGKFLEPITILNVQDRADERVINVKAYLRKPVHFWIQNLHMDFKVCCAMGFGAAGWNATPRRTQPQIAATQQSALQRSTSMQALQRSSSLPPSASVGHLAALAHSFVAPAAPITSSHQRIVVKNISLKPRTFKIKLVEWERTAIKLKRRMIVAPANANNGAMDEARNKSNEANDPLSRMAAPEAMTVHAPRPPPLTTDSPSPTSRALTTNGAFAAGNGSGAPSAGVSPDSPVMSIETYLAADPLPPGLVPLPPPSLSLKLEDVALSSSSLSAFEREEEEEALNHKLRIAIRKKKTDKIERIRNRLSELRDMRMDQRDMAGSSSVGHKDGEATHADGSAAGSAGEGKDASAKTHDSTEGIIFTLEPNAVQNVRATLISVLNGADAAAASRSLPPTAPSTPSSQCQSGPSDLLSVPLCWVELYTGVFHVYETKNKEIIKEVKCSVAIASDLQTQEEWRTDSAAWMASDAAEEAATLEEEDEQDEDAQADKNELEQDAQAHVRTDDAAILNSPRSSKTVPDSETTLPADLQFIRSQSLPTEQSSEVPQLGEQSLSLSALDTARSSADFDATPSSGNASDGYGSPGATATPTTPPTSGSTGALVPVVPSAAMQHQLMQCASSVLLPASMLAALYLPHSFPLYVPASSSAAQLTLSARSHASFFHMLNAHARQLMSGCDPSAPHDVASILALAPANTRCQRGPLTPFEAYIPLEFSSLPALPSMESQSLSSRSRSMPAAHRFSASLKQQEQQASAAAAASYPSPMRLMSGTAASIFRVYIENQVPLSLPSPSFFTLHSHVPTPMIIEVKWIPDADSAQPLSHSESQQHALGYNATHSGMAFGRSSSQSVGQAPITLPVAPGARAESDVPGGYMRVFVKPGTALLTQPNRTTEASLPSAPCTAAERRSRTAASVSHRLPARSQSHHISHAPLATPPSASPITPAPAVSLPPPSQSLFLFLPAHSELDVFMCWLASLLSAIDHVAPAPVAHRRTLRRSTSSFGSVGGSGNYPFVSVETQTSPPEANTGHTHRFKKGIALMDRTVMAEAVLAPATLDPEDGASVTSPTNSEGQSSSGSFKKQAPTLSSIGAGKPNPSLRARAGAIIRSSTLMPGQLAQLQSMAAPPAPFLPRGQLLIRPVGFPSIRSMLGVEVCSVSGTAAQQTHVSPLMLTPERIHAGVVLVDMQGTAGANSIPRSLDSRRPSRSGVSSALLWSSSSQAGVVRGKFVIYNSTTAATRSGAMSSAGRVSVIFGSQSKSTLTSQFVPSHQRATFQFKPARAVIPANDRRIIEFQCHVRTLGHQTHGILVRDVTNDIDIALPVTFTAKEPVYVRFEDCKDDQFDVGLIYAQAALPTTSIPSPSSRPVELRWFSRFSKLVPFRVRNVREYDVRVRVASNCSSELHVFDGEGDVQKSRRCLSCAGGFCSAIDSCCQVSHVVDANDPPSIVDAQPSCPSSVIVRSNSTRTLLLAFTPTMVLSSDSDNTRDFVGGLSFSVFPHRSATNFLGQPTAHPLPTTTQHRLSHSISEPQFIPPLARGSGSQRGFVRFTEEDGTASIVAHGFGDDISEYDDELASDSTNDSARPGTVRKRSLASSTDTEEEDQDDEHGIGSVVSVAHSPADLATDRCLAELNVRVFGRIGVSVFKLEPIGASIDFAEQSEQRPVLHKMETLHNRVSTIDFFALNRVQDANSDDADAPQQPQPPPQPQASHPLQPLRYSVRLSNLSPLLPLCFRLESSSPNLATNVSSGCLAPLSPEDCCPSAASSSIVLDLSLSCPPPQNAGQVQEWISVLVAQQATVDYQRLEDQKQQQQTCNDPQHLPHCREAAHAASSCSVDSTPQPPSLPHEVVDLLGVREELLHTVFLRCLMGGDDSSSTTALRSPQLHLDLPPFSPLPPQGLADESQSADFGSVYVPDEGQQSREGDEGGSNDKTAGWSDLDLLLPALVPAVSRKVAKQKMLESILNPASASGGGSNGGVGVGSGLTSPVSPYG